MPENWISKQIDQKNSKLLFFVFVSCSKGEEGCAFASRKECTSSSCCVLVSSLGCQKELVISPLLPKPLVLRVVTSEMRVEPFLNGIFVGLSRVMALFFANRETKPRKSSKQCPNEKRYRIDVEQISFSFKILIL